MVQLNTIVILVITKYIIMDWNTVAIDHQRRERERVACLQLASNSILSSTNSNLSNHNFQYGSFPPSNNIAQYAPQPPQMNQNLANSNLSNHNFQYGSFPPSNNISQYAPQPPQMNQNLANSNLSNHNFQYGSFPTSNISHYASQMNQNFSQGASTSSAHHATTNENDRPSSIADKTPKVFQMNQNFSQGASTSSAHRATTNENDRPTSIADETPKVCEWIVPTDFELDNFKPSNVYYASKKKAIEALKAVFEGKGKFLVQFIADFHSRIKGLAWVGGPLFKKLGMDERSGIYKKTDKEGPNGAVDLQVTEEFGKFIRENQNKEEMKSDVLTVVRAILNVHKPNEHQREYYGITPELFAEACLSLDPGDEKMPASDQEYNALRDIVDSLEDFVQRHRSNGPRPKEVQDGFDFLACALMSKLGDTTKQTVNSYVSVSIPNLTKAEKMNEHFRETGTHFKPTVRKTHSNSQLPFWQGWVPDNFCHNDSQSRVDSFSHPKHVQRTISGRIDGGGGGWEVKGYKWETHPIRMWEDGYTIDSLYARCTASEEYQQVLKDNPELKRMSRTDFAQSLCKCVAPSKPQSCVNVIMNQQERSQRELNSMLKFNVHLKKIKKECDCPQHKHLREEAEAEKKQKIAEAEAKKKQRESEAEASRADPNNKRGRKNRKNKKLYFGAKTEKEGRTRPGIKKKMKQQAPAEQRNNPSELPSDAPVWQEHLGKTPRDFLRLACCCKVAHPDLQVDGDKEVPMMTPWACGASICQECGVDTKLEILKCPMLAELQEKVKVTIWEDAPRDGGRSQKEPVQKKIPFSEFLLHFRNHSKKALEHMVEAEWAARAMSNKLKTFKENEIVVYTDFSATPNLEAIVTDNSSVANHMILDIFVVCHSPRMVDVFNEDGTLHSTIRVTDCTYWAIVGPTDGYGKKNDHVLHHHAFDHIVDWHTQDLAKRDITLTEVTMFTDNCKGQYKSQFNLYETAAFSERHPGVRLTHCYAPVYEFKGTHDGHGKVVKGRLLKAEKDGERIPDPQTAFPFLNINLAGERTEKWLELEECGDPLLLNRGTKTMTDCRVAYATDCEADFEEMQSKHLDHPHLIFVDRKAVASTVGDKMARGISNVFQVRGFRNPINSGDEGQSNTKYKLELSHVMCFCKKCLVREECPYRSFRNISKIQVCDVTKAPGYINLSGLLRDLKALFKFKTYVNVEQLKKWARQKELTIDPNEAKSMGLTERVFLVLKLHAHCCGSTLPTAETETTLEESLEEGIEHVDEEHGLISESDPTLRQINDIHNPITEQPGKSDSGGEIPKAGYISDEDFFLLPTLDTLSYRDIQANCKARGLGAKGIRAKLIESLTTEVERRRSVLLDSHASKQPEPPPSDSESDDDESDCGDRVLDSLGNDDDQEDAVVASPQRTSRLKFPQMMRSPLKKLTGMLSPKKKAGASRQPFSHEDEPHTPVLAPSGKRYCASSGRKGEDRSRARHELPTRRALSDILNTLSPKK
jgi:hypothetical protein